MNPLHFDQHTAHIQAMMDAALAAANPYTAVSKHLHLTGNNLSVGSHHFDRSNGRLFILSVGKAAHPMAQAALDILGETAVSGGIISKHYPEHPNLPLPAYIGNHPVPGKESLAATTAVLQTLNQTTANDLVLCLISGGASALFSHPRLPLPIWQQLNQALLASGCTIQELNTVRRQLDAVKAGGLARLAAPANVISLILSDVVGNELAAIGSGPTVASDETPADALAIFEKCKLAEFLETAVHQTILNNLAKTPTPPPNNIVDNHIVGSIQQSAQAAEKLARSLGFHTTLLTTRLEGEAREMGNLAAAIAKDAPANSAIILGGETTVTLRGNGIGGRNLETALAAALSLAEWPNRTVTSFATDGDDGPTGMAGATVTGHTVPDKRAALAYLNRNDSLAYFQQQDATGNGPHLIQTGPTGTNVNDLVIILRY